MTYDCGNKILSCYILDEQVKRGAGENLWPNRTFFVSYTNSGNLDTGTLQRNERSELRRPCG